jgi:hypothetical protein
MHMNSASEKHSERNILEMESIRDSDLEASTGQAAIMDDTGIAFDEEAAG